MAHQEPACLHDDSALPLTASAAQQFLRLVGEGSIGRVHHGRWQETDVAIKTLNSLQHIRTLTAEQGPERGMRRSSEEMPPIAQGSFLDDQQAVLRSLEREVRCCCCALASAWLALWRAACSLSLCCSLSRKRAATAVFAITSRQHFTSVRHVSVQLFWEVMESHVSVVHRIGLQQAT